MNYEIKFLKDAFKYLQKLDSTTRNRILDHLDILAEDPRHLELDIKKMQGIENQSVPPSVRIFKSYLLNYK
jgi:mRNA interferase RelE/StbE